MRCDLGHSLITVGPFRPARLRFAGAWPGSQHLMIGIGVAHCERRYWSAAREKQCEDECEQNDSACVRAHDSSPFE